MKYRKINKMDHPAKDLHTHSLPLKFTHSLIDPINRIYRLRLARFLCQKLKNTALTANEVTLAHTVVGVFAAYLIYRERYLFAVMAYEMRTLLDCLDGLLARAKKQVNATGRALDAMGDAITFNALMVAGAIRLMSDFRNYPPGWIILGVFIFALVTAHCGNVYHLMRRKLGSIIKKEVDAVESEWREHDARIQLGSPTFLSKFGFWLDSMTIRFVSKEWFAKVMNIRNLEDWQSKAILEAETMNELACITRKTEFQRAVKATAFMSDDNIFAILCLFFVVLSVFPHSIFPNVHPVLIAFSAGLVYSVFSLSFGLYFLHQFLHGVHRE